jgi:hypothetical protein
MLPFTPDGTRPQQQQQQQLSRQIWQQKRIMAKCSPGKHPGNASWMWRCGERCKKFWKNCVGRATERRTPMNPEIMKVLTNEGKANFGETIYKVETLTSQTNPEFWLFLRL